jgi:hypothetical protein
LVFCILNREDREDRKEKLWAHLAAEQCLGQDCWSPVYRRCLIPIRYKEVVLDCGYRADLLVDESRIKDGIQRMIWRER